MKPAGRIAATVFAAVFALLALASGFDRNAPDEAGMARLVPEPLRSQTWQSQASAALAQGDAGEAERLAALAVNADPLDPRSVSLLATARLAQGKSGEARQAYAIADRMGLRTPLVQAYFFEAALQAGDAEEAARRLDTLLLAHPSMVGTDYFFTALEASDSGRRELARRLQSDPLWARAYLSGFGSGDEILLARARFLAGEGAGVTLGCGRIEPMLRELAVRNYRGDAQRLARAQCPERAAAQAIADPGFEALGEDRPFGWRRHASGDVRITQVGRNDRMVEMENRSGTTRLVLSQPIALEEGEYRVFASVAADRPDALVVSLDCGQPARPTRGSGSLGRGQLVQARPCADQVIGIWLRPRSGAVRLDNLRLEPVGLQDGTSPAISAQ